MATFDPDLMLIWLLLLVLSGCSTSPYVDVRFAYQIDPWSDWVLQRERSWTPDLYWANVECGARIGGEHGLFSKEHLNVR